MDRTKRHFVIKAADPSVRSFVNRVPSGLFLSWQSAERIPDIFQNRSVNWRTKMEWLFDFSLVRNLPAVVPAVACCFVAVLLLGHLHVADGAGGFQYGVLVTDSSFYLQRGRSQRISCTSLANGSDAVVVLWSKVPLVPGGALRPDLLVQVASEVHGGNFSAGGRYLLAPDLALVIRSVVSGDAGTYRCQKVSSVQADSRENEVNVVVLDDEFPAARGVVRTGRNITVSRGRDEVRVSCPIARVSRLREPSLYWSVETRGPDGPTEIAAYVLPDGHSYAAEGYRLTSGRDLVLEALPAGSSFLGAWCHASSARDKVFLQSARVSLHIQDESYSGVIIGVLVGAILILVIIVVLVYQKRGRKSRRRSKERPQLEGPSITSGSSDHWTLEFCLGSRGVKSGGEFSSVRGVAAFGESLLAVLDADGLHAFAPDLARLQHHRAGTGSRPGPAAPGDYVAVATHPDGGRLLLGARGGDVTCAGIGPCDQGPFCSLPAAGPEWDAGSGEPDARREPKGLGKVLTGFFKGTPKRTRQTTTGGYALHAGDPAPSEGVPLTAASRELTDLAVDASGHVYVGGSANGNHRLAVYDPDGRLTASLGLAYPPRLLAGVARGVVLAHSGDSTHPTRRLTVDLDRGEMKEELFIAADASRLNPVKLYAHSGSVYVASDTKCNRQVEILQYDSGGNFLRQFAKPWPGLRGMCVLEYGERLALYDHSVVRVYRRVIGAV